MYCNATDDMTVLGLHDEVLVSLAGEWGLSQILPSLTAWVFAHGSRACGWWAVSIGAAILHWNGTMPED